MTELYIGTNTKSARKACESAFKYKDKLGEGTFGTVYEACLNDDCKYVAKIQLIDNNKPDDKMIIYTELNIYDQINELDISPKLYDAYICNDYKLFENYDNVIEKYYISDIVDKFRTFRNHYIVIGNTNKLDSDEYAYEFIKWLTMIKKYNLQDDEDRDVDEYYYDNNLSKKIKNFIRTHSIYSNDFNDIFYTWIANGYKDEEPKLPKSKLFGNNYLSTLPIEIVIFIFEKWDGTYNQYKEEYLPSKIDRDNIYIDLMLVADKLARLQINQNDLHDGNIMYKKDKKTGKIKWGLIDYGLSEKDDDYENCMHKYSNRFKTILSE
jgi:hypothetical protein